jgi:hypothetical protein
MIEESIAMKRFSNHSALLLFGLLSVAAVIAGLAGIFRPHEPVYQAEPLSDWLDQLYGGYRSPIEAAENAIRSMGPQATPFLRALFRV